MGMRSKSLTEEQHFKSRYTLIPSGCWIWLNQQSARYPSFRYRGARRRASHVSYLIYKGPIPEGMVVCHSCDVSRCVNPDHLFLGTQGDNLQDMSAKGRHGATRDPMAWAEKRFAGKRSKPGIKNPSAKLTPEAVSEIRRRRKAGETMRDLAQSFGVTKSTVFRIIHAETKGGWAHVP